MSNALKLEIKVDGNGKLTGYLAKSNEELSKLSSNVQKTSTSFEKLDKMMATIAHWTASEGIGFGSPLICGFCLDHPSNAHHLRLTIRC